MVAVNDSPIAVRFPKGPVIGPVLAKERVDGADVLFGTEPLDRPDVLLVGVGAFVELAVKAATLVVDQGIGVTVVGPRWVVSAPLVLAELVEPIGWCLAALLRDAEIDVPLRDVAIPQRYFDHGTGSPLLADLELTARDIARQIISVGR